MKKIINPLTFALIICALLQGLAVSCKPEGKTLNAPTELTVGAVTATTAELSWKAVEGVEKYYLAIDDKTSIEVSGTAYKVTELTPETAYSWKVQSVEGSLTSAWALGHDFTTLKKEEPGQHAAPSDLTVGQLTATTAELSWKPVEGVEKYDLTIGDMAPVVVSATAFKATELTPETAYSWKVRSTKGTLTSNWAIGTDFTTLNGKTPDHVTINADNVDITYDNKQAFNKMFTYIMKFSEKATGAEVQLELNTGFTDYYLNFANQSYTLTSQQDETGIVSSDANYFIISTDQARKSFSTATLSIEAIGDSYKVKGSFESADHYRVDIVYQGALPVEKANLLFKTGLLGVIGFDYSFTSFAYFNEWHTGTENKVNEAMGSYMSIPVNKYYEYLPMPAGDYYCSGKVLPFTICTDTNIANSALIFYTAKGKTGTYHSLQSGSMKIVSMSKADELHWKTVAKGEFKTEVKKYRKEDPKTEAIGKKMTFNVTIEGNIGHDPKNNLFFTANPNTRGITANIERTDFTQAKVYYDEENEWTEYGLTNSNPCIDIWLATEGGEWEEWYLEEHERNPNNYYVRTILYVDPDKFEDGVVPVGTWTLDWEGSGRAGTFMPGNLILGQDNQIVGGYFFNGKMNVRAAFGHGPNDPGTITITKNSDDIYTVTGNVYDDRGKNGNNIKFSYTGELPNGDDMDEESVGRSNSHKFKFTSGYASAPKPARQVVSRSGAKH